MNIMAMRWGKLYEGTPAERALEDAVAELGLPYRTQFPGWKYGCRFFPDYFLPTLKLVLEVDDASHDEAAKILADEERTDKMAEVWGVRVARCTNDEALSDPRGAVRAMLQSVGCWPIPKGLPTLAASLPPLRKAPSKGRRDAKHLTRRMTRQKARPSIASPKRPRSGATSPSLPN